MRRSPLYTRVCDLVPVKMATVRKSLLTHVALVWLFVAVCEQMSLEVAACCELLATHLTRVRLFARVCKHVLLQTASFIESLLADHALVWPVTGVNCTRA